MSDSNMFPDLSWDTQAPLTGQRLLFRNQHHLEVLVMQVCTHVSDLHSTALVKTKNLRCLETTPASTLYQLTPWLKV